MSKWLKSVNNLLDNIDGQAGTLQENAVVRGRDVLQNVLRGRNDSEYDDDEYYEDDDDYSGEYDDAEEGAEDEEGGVEEAEGEHGSGNLGAVTLDTANRIDDTTRGETPSAATAPESVQEGSEMSYDDVGEDSDVQRQMQQMNDSDSSPDTVKVETPKLRSAPIPLKAPSSVANNLKSAPPPPTSSDRENLPTQAARPPEPLTITNLAPPSAYSTHPSHHEPIVPLSTPRTPSMPTPPPSAGTDIHLISKALKKSRAEVKKLQQEGKQWKQKVSNLEMELQGAQREIEAQQKELQRAATQIQKERDDMKEEREDLLDEQEDELEQQKEHYEGLIQAHRKQHAQEKAELEGRLKNMEQIRKQEGGDYTAELEESLEREREALRKLNEVTTEKEEVARSLTDMKQERAMLQSKLDSTIQSLETASKREQEAEEKLDATVALNSRKLTQVKSRESELEKTITELGSALALEQQRSRKAEAALARSKSGSGMSQQNEDIVSKEDLRMAQEELQSAQTQLQLEQQRCEVMRKELQDLTSEQAKEASVAQSRQREQDLEMEVLRSTISRLQASLKRQDEVVPLSLSTETTDDNQVDPEQVARLRKDHADTKKQVQTLSEQLVRHQEQGQRAKSEILALKGRLQTEKVRADAAEHALTTTSSLNDSRSFGSGSPQQQQQQQLRQRRRVKGGKSSVRSIRSALDMGPGRVADGMEPIAQTIDGIDSFMVETGSFMKQEPLARLLFLFYLCILHLWSFCLVIFHAHSYEVIHGDLGNLSEAGGEFAPQQSDAAMMAALRGRAANQP